jgi:alkyldihydroxyacetonephosphate synthase
LAAALDAGATLAHHHGVGRSKAPWLGTQLGDSIEVVRALMRAFDPSGILNPGNLVGDAAPMSPAPHPSSAPLAIDPESQLVEASGDVRTIDLERSLNDAGFTLDASPLVDETVSGWLARGAPGSRDPWMDPVDHLLAGLDATLHGGTSLHVRPAPRRAEGPDLTALFLGAHGRFGRIDRAWLRIHGRAVARPCAARFQYDRDPAPNGNESALLDAIDAALKVRRSR